MTEEARTIETLDACAKAMSLIGQQREETLGQIADSLRVMLGGAVALADGLGNVVGYQIKTGALHRVLGYMAGLDHPVTVPLCRTQLVLNHESSPWPLVGAPAVQEGEAPQVDAAGVPAGEWGGLSPKQAWWAGYRVGKGLPPDMRRSEAVAAPMNCDCTQQATWSAIETAPKDGTRIVLWIVHGNAQWAKDPVAEGWAGPCVGSWLDFNGGGWSWSGLCGNPTHWAPLLPPPAVQDATPMKGQQQ